MPHQTSLSVKPLGRTFAAEVSGLDFSSPLADSIVDELSSIISKYGVVVVRNSNLNDDSLIALGRRFGELDSVKSHRLAGRAMRIPIDEIFDVGNLDDKDQIVTAKDPERAATANGNALFHADGSFNPRRTGLSMLRAVELPPPDMGGETEYLDCRAAYEDLPKKTKDSIKDYVACHSLFHNRKVANPDSPLFKDVNVLAHPLAKHKVAQVHEATGRGTLYVTSYAHHIDGLPTSEGQEILEGLFGHIQQEKYKFVHHWESPGDLAIWDNTSVLHRATHGQYEGKFRRDMRRVSVFDTGPTAYGENSKADLWQQGLP